MTWLSLIEHNALVHRVLHAGHHRRHDYGVQIVRFSQNAVMLLYGRNACMGPMWSVKHITVQDVVLLVRIELVS